MKRKSQRMRRNRNESEMESCQTCDANALRANKMTRNRDEMARKLFGATKWIEHDLNEILICLDSNLGPVDETHLRMAVRRAEEALKRIRDLRD